jgi:hypothetical protein
VTNVPRWRVFAAIVLGMLWTFSGCSSKIDDRARALVSALSKQERKAFQHLQSKAVVGNASQRLFLSHLGSMTRLRPCKLGQRTKHELRAGGQTFAAYDVECRAGRLALKLVTDASGILRFDLKGEALRIARDLHQWGLSVKGFRVFDRKGNRLRAGLANERVTLELLVVGKTASAPDVIASLLVRDARGHAVLVNPTFARSRKRKGPHSVLRGGLTLAKGTFQLHFSIRERRGKARLRHVVRFLVRSLKRP